MNFRLLIVFAITFACTSIQAQEYPVHPVTVSIPFSSGSASDVIARIALERMSTSVGQRFLVDNRPAAAQRPASYRLRSGGAVLDSGLSFEDVMKKRFGSRTGIVSP